MLQPSQTQDHRASESSASSLATVQLLGRSIQLAEPAGKPGTQIHGTKPEKQEAGQHVVVVGPVCTRGVTPKTYILLWEPVF